MSAPTTALAVRQDFSESEIEIIKDTVARGVSDTELRLFIAQAERTGLDPIHKQIYAIKRWDPAAEREIMTIQVAIDGLRLIAQRTGEFEGREGPFWCGADGVWTDIWLDPTKPPYAAKVGVWRAGCKAPIWAIALYHEYVQKKRNGQPTHMWASMPANQIAKCAEAAALRAAFAADTSGLYTHDEMGQADNGAVIEGEVRDVTGEPRTNGHAPEASRDPSEPNSPGFVDRYRKHWFVAVKGGPLDSDKARAQFLWDYTDGDYASLTKYLEVCTDAEAEKLIAEAKRLTVRDGEVRRRFIALQTEALNREVDLTEFTIDGTTPTSEIEELGARLKTKLDALPQPATT